MSRGLWCKKVWNGRSKGISTVLGTVFLVLVVFAVSTNVFLWTISQNAQYTQAVKDENQKNVDRLSENVIASGGNYSVSGDEVTVKVTLTNAGPVAAQIINLWVFDTDQSNQRYTNKPLDLNLNPGDARAMRATVTIPGANQNHTFVSWFVTARGNTVPLEKEKGIIIAHVSQGIGSIGMTFPDFKYYNVSQVDESDILKNYTDGGGEGFTVPLGQDIAFQVYLTNFDQSKEDINLSSHSALWMLFPASEQQPRGAWWYIVNVDADGTIAATFTTITLPYGVPTRVFFASSTDGDFSPSRIKAPISANQPAAVNLMLIGKIGNSAYGQNIPFVSVYVQG